MPVPQAPLSLTPFQLAQRYVGIKELAGEKNHPLIQWWLSLCGFNLNTADEIPWCSAFVNGIAWELRLPRSKSAAARSWLTVGTPLDVVECVAGFDVIVLKYSTTSSGPDVIDAPGHVGFFAGSDSMSVFVLGGNQGDSVSIARFPLAHVLGARRLM